VPDRGHTKSSQVLRREPWQDLGVDLILAEDGLVTLQAQLPQPSRDVHRVPRRAIETPTPTDGDIVDLGDRTFEVVHTPGHSPGGIGLFERATRIFLSGDIIYDGPLIDDAYHSDCNDYLATMGKLRTLPVSVVHGGHFPSFGATRFRQIIDEYCAGRRKPGCHLT
jgi:glyoxylase-like metal-dependent hydrolase (beta-lactamase superfamily II)